MQNQKSLNLKTIITIHSALGLGVFAFFVVVCILYFSHKGPVSKPDEVFSMIAYFIPGLILIAGFISNFIFSKNIDKNLGTLIQNDSSKYQIFGTAHIIRMAILEGPAMFGLVILILFTTQGVKIGNNLEMIFPIFGLGVFFAFWVLFFPTEFRINMALKIDSKRTN